MKHLLEHQETSRDPEEIRQRAWATQREITARETRIEKLLRQIRASEEKSFPEKLRALKERELEIVGKMSVVQQKVLIAEKVKKGPLFALDVFTFLPGAESFLPALAAIITGKSAQIVQRSLEAKKIAEVIFF